MTRYKPIDLSGSRSGGKFEARFRIWGNHNTEVDGQIIPSDPDMPPARTLWRSEKHGITVRLNDNQPAASPGGAVILSAEGPTEGYKRVADLAVAEPTRAAKMGVVAAMMSAHTEQVFSDPEILEATGLPAGTSMAYTGSMNANAAVWSPHTNTVPVYAPTGPTSWMLATGTAPAELRTPLNADHLAVVQNALVVPEAVGAEMEAALDQISGREAVVSAARDHYVEYLANVAAGATITTAA
jgi:hypothetical protein